MLTVVGASWCSPRFPVLKAYVNASSLVEAACGGCVQCAVCHAVRPDGGVRNQLAVSSALYCELHEPRLTVQFVIVLAWTFFSGAQYVVIILANACKLIWVSWMSTTSLQAQSIAAIVWGSPVVRALATSSLAQPLA